VRLWRRHHYGPGSNDSHTALALSSQSLGDSWRPVCRHARAILSQQRSENDPRAHAYPYSLWACVSGNVARQAWLIHDDDHMVRFLTKMRGREEKGPPTGQKRTAEPPDATPPRRADGV
jgi:hypothetical protein